MNKPLRIGIVAGEASGDILGVGLMRAIKERHPDAVFEGIGGPEMIAEGFTTLVQMERLSVMGFIEILGRLPEILRIKKKIEAHFINHPPDVYVGIDSPDFNLRVETTLRKRGIKTIQYVGPSVWAYRENRIKKIALAVDMVLTLLPFETEVYKKNNIMVRFVGHTLADKVDVHTDIEADKAQARMELGLVADKRIIVLLPGSRKGEVKRLAGIFIQAAKQCARNHPELQFIIPCVNKYRKIQLEKILHLHNCGAEFNLLDGQSHIAIKAADLALMASGTVALEALLYKRPMIVCYRINPLTYMVVSRMLKVPYISLPNLLANRAIVPEYLQTEVTEDILAKEMHEFLSCKDKGDKQIEQFAVIHQSIRCDADRTAANSVLEIAGA